MAGTAARGQLPRKCVGAGNLQFNASSLDARACSQKLLCNVSRLDARVFGQELPGAAEHRLPPRRVRPQPKPLRRNASLDGYVRARSLQFNASCLDARTYGQELRCNVSRLDTRVCGHLLLSDASYLDGCVNGQELQRYTSFARRVRVQPGVAEHRLPLRRVRPRPERQRGATSLLDLCADGQEFLDTASRFGVFAHGQSGTHTSLDGHVGAKDSQFDASSLDARAYDQTHERVSRRVPPHTKLPAPQPPRLPGPIGFWCTRPRGGRSTIHPPSGLCSSTADLRRGWTVVDPPPDFEAPPITNYRRPSDGDLGVGDGCARSPGSPMHPISASGTARAPAPLSHRRFAWEWRRGLRDARQTARGRSTAGEAGEPP